jgi:hypothetical protein
VPGRCSGALQALPRAFPLLGRASVLIADGGTGSARDHFELFSQLAQARHLRELRLTWRASDARLLDSSSWGACRAHSDALWAGLQQALPLVSPRPARPAPAGAAPLAPAHIAHARRPHARTPARPSRRSPAASPACTCGC